jgi:FMN-dependent NADH-azoreductase
MKTLVVSYLPRGERSHTKKLLDAFLETASGQKLEHLDLLADTPDMFLAENLGSYIKRNYLGDSLSEAENAAMAKMDRMTQQLKNTDALVLAFPMHNFSFPAVVKAWFDSVMQKDETWTVDDNGYVPLMTGKKALVLMSSGGVYEGDFAGYEHAATLAQTELGFMGFDTTIISAAGMNSRPDPEVEVSEKIVTVKQIASRWGL